MGFLIPSFLSNIKSSQCSKRVTVPDSVLKLEPQKLSSCPSFDMILNFSENSVPCDKSWLHCCNLSQAPQAPLVYFFPAGVLFSTENAKGTILNMPCHALP